LRFPTWQQLIDTYCYKQWIKINGRPLPNPHYEHLASRRYNFSAIEDEGSCRLVFLNPVLKDPRNKTLVRGGRFIWCRNLNYNGLNEEGFRTISFTVDQGSKVFTVSERNVLCIPSNNFINNNRRYGGKEKIFRGFSSVFSYKNTLDMMSNAKNIKREDLLRLIENDNPFKPGTLVTARMGYYFPKSFAGQRIKYEEEYPCGIILGRSLDSDNVHGREFYRVRFNNETHESVHPVQMEIIK